MLDAADGESFMLQAKKIEKPYAFRVIGIFSCFGGGFVWGLIYCTYDWQKINAWRARGECARVSVNFRKFSPCMARAARARGFDSLPSLSDVGTVSFR